MDSVLNEYYRWILFLPEQASTMAATVDHLHFFIITVTMIMSTLVGLTAVWFFIRYRRRSEAQATKFVEQPVWFEILVVTIPLGIFLLWFAIGYRDYVQMATPPENSMDVYVMGKQWMWKFAYPGGPSSINTLTVPANKPVRLLLTSRDVIHSFFVPAFRMKKDVLPGRYVETWFEATKPGRYDIECTEYCGTGHSTMLGEVVVLSPPDFEHWLNRQKRGPAGRQNASKSILEPVDSASDMVAEGRKLAGTYSCLKCHSLDGEQHIGPTWLNLYHRHEKLQNGQAVYVDEGYITESMMDPTAKIVAGYQPVMPVYQGKISAPETAAIVEFIKSLRNNQVPNPPSQGPVYESRTSR